MSLSISRDERLQISPDDRIARSGDLVFAEIDGEAVALSIPKSACYGLNHVGLRILQFIDTPTSVNDICERLVTVYEVDPEICERDVIDLLSELEREGLVDIERRSAGA